MSAIGYVNVSLEISGGVLLLILALCLRIGSHPRDRLHRLFLRLLFCNTLVLFSDAAAWLCKGRMNRFCYYGVRISNFLSFSASYLLLTIFTEYFTRYLEERGRVSRLPLTVVRSFCVLALVLVTVSQFNHMFYLIDAQNIYRRQGWFWLSQAGGIAGLCVNAWLLLRHRGSLGRVELAAFASYLVLPALAMLVQIFSYGVALLNLATTVSILILFLFIQMEQAAAQRKRELELSETRLSVLLGQIRPHFLYNTLTAIRQLCDSDPGAAREAVTELAGYLRGNLDALTARGCVTFEREMEQVRNYLSLEQKRFGGRLRVEYDLRAGGFSIPPLTVQPLAENAVRHGATQRPDGGTVTVSSFDAGTAYAVCVSDDGPGFPLSREAGDDRARVGLENVSKRLGAVCGGTLRVESVPGRGASVTILIPKGDGPNAGDRGGR